MIRKIVIHAYLQLINNSKLGSLTLSTLFAHSLISVFLIIYNTYYYIENQFNLHTSNEVLSYIMNLFQFDSIGRTAVWIWLFLFIGYFVLSPIWESTIVHYLHHNNKLRSSLGFGFENFHYIAKFDGMVFIFGFIIFLNILSKVFLNGMNNALVLSFMFIWLLLVLFVTFFFQYAKTIIILEKIPVFEAVKKSIALSIEHFWVTSKFVLISILFNLRLIFNILFLIGIPLAAIVLLQFFGVVGVFADTVVYILFFWLLLFLAYINTLIEWYFRIYRYMAYLDITWNNEQLTKLWLFKNNMWGLFEDHKEHSDDLELLYLGS